MNEMAELRRTQSELSEASSMNSEKKRQRAKQNTAATAYAGDDGDEFFGGSENISTDGNDDTNTDESLTENLSCGRGIITDWRRTVGTWWWKEMTNFNQKTIAVTL